MQRDETRKLMAQFNLSTRDFLPSYDAYSEEGVKFGFDMQNLLVFIEIRDPSTASYFDCASLISSRAGPGPRPRARPPWRELPRPLVPVVDARLLVTPQHLAHRRRDV